MTRERISIEGIATHLDGMAKALEKPGRSDLLPDIAELVAFRLHWLAIDLREHAAERSSHEGPRRRVN